jgi:hypothetical protein
MFSRVFCFLRRTAPERGRKAARRDGVAPPPGRGQRGTGFPTRGRTRTGMSVPLLRGRTAPERGRGAARRDGVAPPPGRGQRGTGFPTRGRTRTGMSMPLLRGRGGETRRGRRVHFCGSSTRSVDSSLFYGNSFALRRKKSCAWSFPSFAIHWPLLAGDSIVGTSAVSDQSVKSSVAWTCV